MRIFEGGDELMYGTGDVFMGGQTRENVVVGKKSDSLPLSHPAHVGAPDVKAAVVVWGSPDIPLLLTVWGVGFTGVG